MPLFWENKDEIRLTPPTPQFGYTALMYATFGVVRHKISVGHKISVIALVQALIEAGANIDIQCRVTFVHRLILIQNMIFTFLFLFFPQNGITALMIAAREGRIAVVQALLEARAAIDLKNDVNGFYRKRTPHGLK